MKCELCKDTGFINGFNCIACNATTQPVHPCRVDKIVPKYMKQALFTALLLLILSSCGQAPQPKAKISVQTEDFSNYTISNRTISVSQLRPAPMEINPINSNPRPKED